MIYRFGPFRLDAAQLVLEVNEEPLGLGPKVVETLLALVERAGDVCSKKELLDRVWPEGFVEEANLAQNIYVIRKTLRAHWNGDAIVTVPRRGYRFAQPVHAGEPVPARVVKPRGRWMGLAVAAALAAALIGGTVQIAMPRSATPALSAEGARLYALGKYYWNQRTAGSLSKSERYFNGVISVDPRSAVGYAALAATYAIEGDYGFGTLHGRAAYERAARYARRALAANASSAEAHAVLGFTYDRIHGTQQRAAAIREYQRAIALDPAYAPAHEWYGILLLRGGNGMGALRELQSAAQLDPSSVAGTDWLAEAAYFARRYRQSIAYAKQALDLSPQRTDANIPLGLSYEAMGKFAQAAYAYRAYAHDCDSCAAESAALLAHLYATQHRFDAASAQLRVATAPGAVHDVDPADVAMALVAMGRKSDALRMLGRHDPGWADGVLALDPRLDPVRGDRRFSRYTRNPAA